MRMPDLYIKLRSATSVLLVIPSDKDYAGIYLAAAIFKALANSNFHRNTKFYLLNDHLSQTSSLQKELIGNHFQILHTKSFKLYTVSLDKKNNNISEIYTDDTEEKFVFSFESEQHDIDINSVITIKPSLISFDLILQLGTQNILTQPKYKSIIEKIGKGKEFYFTHKFLALETSVMFKEMGYDLDFILLNKSLSEAATAEEMLNNHAVLNFFLQNNNDIYGIKEAINSSQNIHPDDFSVINLADNTYAQIDENIYCSIIDNRNESLPMPRYMHCKFFDLNFTKMAFVIINRKDYSQIYLYIRNDSHKSLILASNNAEIIKDCIIFRSSKSNKFIQEYLLNLAHQFDHIQTQQSIDEMELSTTPINSTNTNQIPQQPKFTQGLTPTDPLAPPIYFANVNNEIQQQPNPKTDIPVIEEC